MAQNISEAKSAGIEGAQILGYQKLGGILRLPDGRLGALKHDEHRYNHGSKKPWGREGCAYMEADVVPIGYHMEVPPQHMSAETASEWLRLQEEGEAPAEATVGVEVEAVTYDGAGMSLATAHGPLFSLEQNGHPELLSHVLETATGKTPEGRYPRTAPETAYALAQAVNEAEEIAALQGKRLVYSSVPEGGNGTAEITPHPYLLAFSPKVLEATLDHQQVIPPEVIGLYRQIGIDIIPYLRETGILNWPVNALHVHNGVPQIEGLADPRSGYAMAQVRMTELSKILSLMLYNTKHCYGVDTGLKDVRSLMRRLLATSHDSTLPPSAEEFIHDAVGALEKGEIHSLPRHPWQGQHDRIRIRMDGDKKTMESIDAAMNPDLRLVLGWIYGNELMNTLALDALKAVNGDESRVLPYLQSHYGDLLRPIPALGNDSSYSHDLLYNRSGYDATVPWLNGRSYRELLRQSGAILQQVGSRYPALRNQADMVKHLISQQTAHTAKPPGLAEYMGVESGSYMPNNCNKGLITDAKNLPLDEIIAIQSEGTRLQAESLSSVRDATDLRAWIGLP